ncbi:MarR family transcriptional regulator [Herbiconiux moechotypicola]|uniref:MarR family transcriptional regulator n=1 Tax=Herbiconiux moechotypicola TaxID=637393 RepID=A0ABP5QHH9_9MICO|nr:MarR family transcriptional regulator [Herbiconiux moechotypicola]MCS5729939.1 MarR family transcriptional regulator [Herbiconiux moechotypicola]
MTDLGHDDDIDRIRAGWHTLAPELDTGVIDVAGRILRGAALLIRRGDEFLAGFGLTRGEFDILSALRRAGRRLSPGELTTVSLASGPATTKRLKALETRGLVVRTPNPHDGRGAFIEPTAAGARLIDDVFPRLLTVEREMVAALTPDELAETGELLRRVLASFERAGGAQTSE